MDVLGYNFRNDSNLAEATQAVGFLPDMELHSPIPENLPYPASGDQQSIGFFGALTFVSLRAHTIYWETEFESESSCFSPLITRLYQGDQAIVAIARTLLLRMRRMLLDKQSYVLQLAA